jgi:hypothetical protein
MDEFFVEVLSTKGVWYRSHLIDYDKDESEDETYVQPSVDDEVKCVSKPIKSSRVNLTKKSKSMTNELLNTSPTKKLKSQSNQEVNTQAIAKNGAQKGTSTSDWANGKHENSIIFTSPY